MKIRYWVDLLHLKPRRSSHNTSLSWRRFYLARKEFFKDQISRNFCSWAQWSYWATPSSKLTRWLLLCYWFYLDLLMIFWYLIKNGINYFVLLSEVVFKYLFYFSIRQIQVSLSILINGHFLDLLNRNTIFNDNLLPQWLPEFIKFIIINPWLILIIFL